MLLIHILQTSMYLFFFFFVFFFFCCVFCFLMIRRPPRSTLDRSSAASDVYKRQAVALEEAINRIDFYNTGVSFSGDGQRMYFTRAKFNNNKICLLYTSPSPRDRTRSRMPSSA